MFSSLQSQFAQKELSLSNQSLVTIILKENDQTYTQSTAVLRILFHLGPGWNIFAIIASIFPLFLRDTIYQIIAKNRYSFFGKSESCRLPTLDEKKLFLE